MFEAIYAFLIFSNRSSIFSGTALIFYKITLYLVYMFQQESKFHQGDRKESLSYLLGFIKVFWVCIDKNLKISDKMHWENPSFMYKQFISLNSAAPILVVCSSCNRNSRTKEFLGKSVFSEHLFLRTPLDDCFCCKENLIQLFWETCRFFYKSFCRFSNHAKQA